MPSPLQAALTQLSGAQKDRQTGLKNLKDYLNDPSAQHDLDASDWDRIFKTIGSTLEVEREGYLKKLNSEKALARSAETRLINTLEQFAQTFRWLCEIGADYITPPLVKWIIDHILQNISYRDTLFKPFAPSYARSLRILLSHQRHRYHIPAPKWHALLDLSIKTLTSSSSSHGDYPDASQDTSFTFDSPSTPRFKRQASTINQEMVELSHVFASLIISSSRDFPPDLTVQILTTIKHFLSKHSTENSCHLPLISVLNHMLYEYASNDAPMVWDYLVRICPYLIPLWDRRNTVLRPQILNVWRFYIKLGKEGAWQSNPVSSRSCWCDESDADSQAQCPCLSASQSERMRKNAKEYRTFLSQLYEVVTEEIGSKGGIPYMSTPDLFLVACLTSPHTSRTPASINHLWEDSTRFGSDFLDRDFLSWCFTDLASDCFAEMMYLESLLKTDKPNLVASSLDLREGDRTDSPRPRKRARGNDVLSFVQSVLGPGFGMGKGEKAFVVQILSVMFWKGCFSGGGVDVRGLARTVLDSATFDDVGMRGWWFVCLGALAGVARLKLEAVGVEGWKRVWDSAVRRVFDGGVGRDGALYLIANMVRNESFGGVVVQKDLVGIVRHLLSDAGVGICELEVLSVVARLGGRGREGELAGLFDSKAVLDWCVGCLGASSNAVAMEVDGASHIGRVKEQDRGDVPAVICVERLVRIVGLSVGQGGGKEDSIAGAIVTQMPYLRRKDEYLGEWRLEKASVLTRAILKNDLFTMQKDRIDGKVITRSGNSNDLNLILGLLVERVQAETQHLQRSSAAGIEKSSWSLAVSGGLYAYLVHGDVIDKTVEERFARLGRELDAFVGAIAKCLRESDGVVDSKVLQTLITFFSFITDESLNSIRSRTFSLSNDTMSNLLESLSLCLESSRTAHIVKLERTTPRKQAILLSSSISFDDFNLTPSQSTPTFSQSRSSSTPAASLLNLDYFGLSEVEGERNRFVVLVLRVVGLVYRVGTRVAGERGGDEMALDVGEVDVDDGIFEFVSRSVRKGEFAFGGDETVVEWLDKVGGYLRQDQTRTILQSISTCLLDYEKNPWMHLFVVRSLTSLLPVVTKFSPHDPEIDDLVQKFVKWLGMKTRPSFACWRLSLQFGRFLLGAVEVGCGAGGELEGICGEI
ncbi:Serine/threonine-protein kinase tel1, partial [Rhizophlyctis rosea]